MNRQSLKQTHFDELFSWQQFNIQFYLLPAHFLQISFAMLEFQQQVFTSQNYPYLQKHSWVPGTEIATLKHAFFVEPLGVDGGVNPLGKLHS